MTTGKIDEKVGPHKQMAHQLQHGAVIEHVDQEVVSRGLVGDGRSSSLELNDMVQELLCVGFMGSQELGEDLGHSGCNFPLDKIAMVVQFISI